MALQLDTTVLVEFASIFRVASKTLKWFYRWLYRWVAKMAPNQNHGWGRRVRAWNITVWNAAVRNWYSSLFNGVSICIL